ncbi:MAG: STAS domain-containing protein [Solirubrobacteraceae bacterium]
MDRRVSACAMSYLPPTFELRVETVDDRTAVLSVRGEIHLATAPDFSEGLNQVIAEGRTAVVVDLTEVGFIDSTGLSVLLNALRRITRAGGTLVIVCTNPTVLRLFEVTKMDTTFTIVSSRDEAVASARR